MEKTERAVARISVSQIELVPSERDSELPLNDKSRADRAEQLLKGVLVENAQLRKAIAMMQRGASPAEDNLDFLYGRQAICRFLGMPVDLVRDLIADGTIPTFRMGRLVCARRSEIRRQLASAEHAR